jgi:hypothetical protein
MAGTESQGDIRESKTQGEGERERGRMVVDDKGTVTGLPA